MVDCGSTNLKRRTLRIWPDSAVDRSTSRIEFEGVTVRNDCTAQRSLSARRQRRRFDPARTIWRRKARALAIFLCGASCRFARSFAKKVAGDVDYCKPPSLFCKHLKIRLDEDLDRLLAGVDLNANRCSAKIHFVPATILSSNDGMRHLHLAPDKLDVITACVYGGMLLL